MTELERTLTNSLTALEQELTAIQEAHTKMLEEHSQAIQRLQQSVKGIETEQQQSAQLLQHLSDIHANLEPLLLSLSAMLNTR